MDDDPTAEVTDLLQQLIRNACVNDGSVTSGGEARSVDVLRSLLDVPGIDVETYAPQPGRENLVARIEGRDPHAPTLCLMGHTDVVPVNPEGWRRDPFGGELVDGEVWGRGAIDMLNLTASMAVAVRRLAQSGFRPEGTLIYLAVADEEALGTWGAQHLVDHERDAVQADYVITESGGIPIPGFGPGGGLKLPVLVGEKGCYWTKLTVKGTPGHGSQPFRTDNALVKAAEVVRRIAEHRGDTTIHDTWRGFVQGLELPPELAEPLLDPDRFWDALDALPDGMARQFHACTHTTVSANIVHGGQKINVIPDTVELELDVRTLPGWGAPDVEAMLLDAIGPDLVDHVRIEVLGEDPSTISAIDTPLWDSLTRITKRFYADSATIPMLMVGATDARFFRRLGATAYGFGLFSQRLSYEDFATMFHGDDERVDTESLRLSTELWQAVAHDLLDAPTGARRSRSRRALVRPPSQRDLRSSAVPITAALFDFGGVILSSPFDAFAQHETELGLPDGFIRQLNATDPDTNAWARFERNDISVDEFVEAFEAEARAAGYPLDARAVLGLLAGELRPEMVEAVRRCHEQLKTALLTNNVVSMDHTEADGRFADVLGSFDAIIESSKVGVRKPDPRFYEMACQALAIEPTEAVFLDDLGVNLKPARELGMTTIKVTDPAQAIAELEAVVGFPLR